MTTERVRAPLPTWLPWLGWLTGSVFFFYAWILRVAPSVMVEELMRDFAASGAIVGQLSALYFYAYAGMQIPVGVLIDRFGPRRLMSVAAAVCAFGCLLFGISDTLASALAGRFLIGLGSAFSLVGAMAVAGLWFPAHRFAVLSGGAMLIGVSGGVFGQAPLRLAVDALGWRQAIVVLAGFGLVLVFAAWASVRDRAGDLAQTHPGMWRGLRDVARNRQTWLSALAGLGATGPLLAFAGLWGVPFLQSVYAVDRPSAGAVTSLVFVGFALGAPIIGWISDRAGRRGPIVGGTAICAAALAAVLYWPALSLGATSVLCFVVGFASAAQIACFALVREHNPAPLSATAIGIVNTMVTGAGALFQPLIGWLLDLRWDGRLVDGARIYDADSYRLVMGVLVVACLAGCICAMALRDQRE